MGPHEMASKISSLEHDLWSKASTHDLDAANRRIRALESELQQEKTERYAIEALEDAARAVEPGL